MFKQLLVTLDGTPRAEAVMPHAVHLTRAMSGEVTLLRVVNGDASASMFTRNAARAT